LGKGEALPGGPQDSREGGKKKAQQKGRGLAVCGGKKVSPFQKGKNKKKLCDLRGEKAPKNPKKKKQQKKKKRAGDVRKNQIEDNPL